MSEYENVVVGILRLKEKALDVKTGGIKKKKKHREQYVQYAVTVGGTSASADHSKVFTNDADDDDGKRQGATDFLTPAEKRYLQQWEKIDLQRMAKMAAKSHRDRIHEFNQYLANLSEH